MQPQNMVHAQIAVPPDCLALVTDLVTKLGGQVMADSFPPCSPMPELERGGKMLKSLRQRAGMTQKEVADALGLPQSHISEFEKDKRNIPYKHAKKTGLTTAQHPQPLHTPELRNPGSHARGGGRKRPSLAARSRYAVTSTAFIIETSAFFDYSAHYRQ